MFKVMIVDDEPLERQALKIIISKLENIKEVIEACNGKEALELEKKYNPDIIVMDVRMPGIDGIKAAQIIKKENSNKIIIMVTAHDDFEMIHNALVLGVNDYILKPINPDNFIKVISNSIVNLKINEEKPNEYKIINKQSKSSPIESAIIYIKNNLNENIKLEQMASLCNLSSCYFSKVFKKETGINFSTFVNTEKVNKATKLLKDTDIPILNLALDLGYDDCGYFIRVFKKYIGVTPKKYRENNKLY